MPELPEVEVVRRRLSGLVLDRMIREVRASHANYAFLTGPAQLKRRLTGRRFTAINRHGKYLILTLDDGTRFVVHLGMTGQLFASSAINPRLYHSRTRSAQGTSSEFVPDEHTHLSLEFADGGPGLHFRDSRKFGKLLWLPKDVEEPRLQRLGVDALKITAPQLAAASAKRRIAVKALLLDQSVLAGVGNIYADESLFQAHILPLRPSHELTFAEIRELAQCIRRVLSRAIARGGSTIDDYVHPDGSEGQFQHSFSVYGREGKPCRRCRTPIARVVIGQRSSHFCGTCQR
jgi:formamidopyrimidine-DNA glycosylase